MSVTSTDLSDSKTIKSCNLERNGGLTTFLRVKATLSVSIVTTGNYITIAGQEDCVRSTATDLYDFFFKDVESFQSHWQVGLFELGVAELSALIITPGEDFSFGSLLTLRVVFESSAANDSGEIGST